jgi:hypothetical protein
MERVRTLSWLLDNSIPIPGTRWRIGLDPLLGLIPGLGDSAGAILSGYVLVEAARMGASRGTLLRMAWNILVEWVVGLVPLVGDLFDAAWKANQRNIGLMERAVLTPASARRRDRGFLVALLIGMMTLGAALITGSIVLLKGLLSLLG